jgi:hypothetical protein
MATNIESIGSTDPDFTDSMGVIGVGAVNVKMHFGAVGDGVADDTTAIQNAFNESVLASNGFSSGTRGGVYFPPGTYKITAPLIIGEEPFGAPTATTPQGIGRIFGHRGTVLLTGNFAGFMFDNPNEDPEPVDPDDSTNTNLEAGVIEGLNFINTHTGADSGCIRVYSASSLHIRDCHFQGHNGVLLGGFENGHICFDSTIESCKFTAMGTEASRDTGSLGCSAGHQVRVIGCAFTLWDTALRLFGAQASSYSNRFEVCNIAIKVGERTDGSTLANAGGVIVNSSFESNSYDIHLRDANGLSIIGAQSQGSQDGDHNSQSSIRYVGGSNITIMNYVCSGTYDQAPFWIESDPSSDLGAVGLTFINCNGGMLWAANTHAGCCEQINSELFIDFTNTVAKLPTYATAGMRRTVNNANQVIGTDAWGTQITAHVSTGSWAPCWYDGSADVWRLG